MLYQKKGDTVLDSGKVFTVGGEVFANHACDYEGLFGQVTEIRTGPDQCAEQGAPDICCAFQPPESRAMVEDIQERLSARFRHPKHLEDLGFVAGGTVTVVAALGGNVIVKVKEARIAISEEMARKIMI